MNNKQKYKLQIIDNLEKCKIDNLLQDYGEVTVNSIWQTWTFWQKCVWIVLHWMRFGYFTMKKYYNGLNILNARTLLLDSEDAQKQFNEYKNLYDRWWFQSKPKQVFVVDVKIKQPVDVKSIDITNNIKESQK